MRIDPGSHIEFQALMLFASGALLVFVAIIGAGFFFDHPKARGLVTLCKRNGARAVCSFFGLFLVGLSYWVRLAFR